LVGADAKARFAGHGGRSFSTTLASADNWDPWDNTKADAHADKARLIRGSHGMPNFIEEWTPKRFKQAGALLVASTLGSAALVSPLSPLTVSLAGVSSLYWYFGLKDLKQTKHALLRNFPLLVKFRYLAESIRPEIRQYFIEDDDMANPYSRQNRSLAYQRSKNMSDVTAMGTQRNVNAPGYEFINYSMFGKNPKVEPDTARVLVGGAECKQPYSASLLNVSAMSFGALSSNAILALNRGASLGKFYHNTGEGGLSRYHLAGGGDITWQLGTACFGARDKDGKFCEQKFVDNALRPQVKMIEVKLSQGAKAGKGGMIMAAKNSPEIAGARGIEPWTDCYSPSRHASFHDAHSMLEFVARLRALAEGKPIGIKMAVSQPTEFLRVVQAMRDTGIAPDFITVDGGEGGTGAAPSEFTNSVGMPLHEALHMVNSLLIGANLRDKMRIIAAGKIVSGFSLLRLLALGADFCNAARAFMFALGCVQSLSCHTNNCPTGVATQRPDRVHGLDPTDKAYRVFSFHRHTTQSACDIMTACNLTGPEDVGPEHFYRRVSSTQVLNYAELYPTLPPGCLVDGSIDINRVMDADGDGSVTLEEFRRYSLERRTTLMRH
jgi:glutamate synthase domain-containing protein 2